MHHKSFIVALTTFFLGQGSHWCAIQICSSYLIAKFDSFPRVITAASTEAIGPVTQSCKVVDNRMQCCIGCLAWWSVLVPLAKEPNQSPRSFERSCHSYHHPPLCYMTRHYCCHCSNHCHDHRHKVDKPWVRRFLLRTPICQPNLGVVPNSHVRTFPLGSPQYGNNAPPANSTPWE